MIKEIEDGGTFGYVAYNEVSDEVIVAFRGSVNIQNWVTNLDFISIPYLAVPGAYVHAGF